MLFDGSQEKALNDEGLYDFRGNCLLGPSFCLFQRMASFSVGLERISRIFLDLQ